MEAGIREHSAVVGPGAIGATVAAGLTRAGHDVILCGRRERARLTVHHEPFEPVELGPVSARPEITGIKPDWVVLAVKAHQVSGTEYWLRALCGEETTVVVVQNGVEHRELVAPLLPAGRIIPAIAWFSSEITDAGLITVRSDTTITVPAGPDGSRFAALLDGSGIDVEQSPDFLTASWEKLLVNAVAGLMALAGRRAAMFQTPAVQELALGLAAECAAVARSAGACLADDAADRVVARFVAMPADMGTSILADRENGRPLEWEARNGIICRLGRTHGVATPISDVIVPLLAAAGSR